MVQASLTNAPERSIDVGGIGRFGSRRPATQGRMIRETCGPWRDLLRRMLNIIDTMLAILYIAKCQ